MEPSQRWEIGPGGSLQYVLYLVTSLGYVSQSFEALGYGIELAVVEAHENLPPGSISLNEGEIQCLELLFVLNNLLACNRKLSFAIK